MKGGNMLRQIVSFTLALVLAVVPSIAYAQPGKSSTPKEEDRPTKNSQLMYNEGYLEGQIVARRNYSSSGWFAVGLGSGFLLGLIGTGIAVGVSQTGQVEPPFSYVSVLSRKSDMYRVGFLDGYTKEAKRKRLKTQSLVVFLEQRSSCCSIYQPLPNRITISREDL